MAIYEVDHNIRIGNFVLWGKLGPIPEDGKYVEITTESDGLGEECGKTALVQGDRVEVYGFWDYKLLPLEGSFYGKEINRSPARGHLRFIDSSCAIGKRIILDRVVIF